MVNRWIQIVAVVICLVAPAARGADDSRLLFGFETNQELREWYLNKEGAEQSDKHATQGNKSLTFPVGHTLHFGRNSDWSGFESLEMDLFVEGDLAVQGEFVVCDTAWKAKPTYWNRHNASLLLKPGANSISLPVSGMYRGEPGSRNNDIKTNIDPAQIVRWYIHFEPVEGGGPAAAAAKANLFIDNVRLVKSSRPADVLAFDLGPASQAVFPGFTPIGPATIYGKNGNKAGLKSPANPNWARDSTFPTRLYQDFIALNDTDFIADVPNGKYSVWVVFENLGYWGGEAARFKQRTISAEGKPVDTEDRGQAGPADYLFRFEKIEPKPGDSLWDLYVKDLVAPRRFQTEVADGKLNLHFDGGGSPVNTKVAAIVIYPAGSRAGEEWVKQVELKNRQEFESRVLFMGPKPRDLAIPQAAKDKGYWLGFPSLEQTVTFADSPGAEERELRRSAARNQKVSLTFAIRPLHDLGGPAALTASDLKSAGGMIPASAVDLRYVHHGTHRDLNSTAYQIMPQTLRPVAGANLMLAKDLTRQFWITVEVPTDAKPGLYSGQVALQAGDLRTMVPYSIEVLDLTLDEPDFTMGFYGADIPAALPLSTAEGYRRLLRVLKANGVNSFTGGPNLSFNGLDAGGKPIIEGYAEVDEFFRIARETGFTGEVSSYGGPGMVEGLHEGYVIGRTGRNWEQKTGKSFDELLKIVWADVRQHAQQHNWPPIAYGFTDEPRVLDQATAQLELMTAYRKAVPFVKIGGSYSVDWDKQTPLDKSIQEIFKTLVWSGLNEHNQTDMDKAREFGRELWIYNQGLSRFSWGAYQWAEMSKGVKGRLQWHTLALHGYQYFDLDGREPDTAVIMWGRDQIYPTINLPRCREGADDFRFAVTLWNRAKKSPDKPEAQTAIKWLEQVSDSIPAGKREAPESWKGDEQFRATCAEHLKMLR